VDWEINEQESCSDHIIRYAIGQSADHRTAIDQELRYIVKKDNKENFQRNLTRSAEKLCEINREGGAEKLDKTLYTGDERNRH